MDATTEVMMSKRDWLMVVIGVAIGVAILVLRSR
jgi:hypothetical protein